MLNLRFHSTTTDGDNAELYQDNADDVIATASGFYCACPCDYQHPASSSNSQYPLTLSLRRLITSSHTALLYKHRLGSVDWSSLIAG